MRLITRLRQLDRQQRRDLWPAAWRLVAVRALLILFSVGRIQRWLGGKGAESHAEHDLEPWKRRALALRRIGAILPGTRCLARALALRWWMRNAGLAASLRIGIARASARPSSHAWVEFGDVPIDDNARNLGHFKVIQWTD